MEDDLLGQAQAVLSGSTPKGGLLDEALGVLDKYKPDKEFVDQERRMQEARVWAGQKRGGEKEFGFGLGLRLRTRDLSLPFQGAANAVARGIAGVENPLELQKKAQDAFAKGEATDEQLARLALGEYEQARNQSLGITGKIGQGIGQAAPMVGEALVGGQAVRGLGVAGGAVVNRFAPKVAEKAASLTAKLPSALRSAPVQSAAIQTAATPLTPGLWLEESQQRAVENGGNWYDAKNVAAPMVRAAFQNAIMGHLGEATKGMNVAKRVGLGAALMPAEQAGADALTTLAEKGWKAAGMDEKWATKTEWGTIGQFVRGESGDGWASLATQATMGALFAGFMGQKADPVKKLASAADSLAKDGVPQDLAGRVINEAMNRPPETIKNPEVRAFVEDIIDLKPVEPPKTRSAGPSPEPVQTPVEAKKTAPEKPRTANEALAKLEDPFGEYKPKGPVEPYRPPAASERMVNETDAPATPPEKPKIGAKKVGKKDLVTQKQKAVEEAKAKEEARKESLRRDQAENDAALDNFFAKPIEETKAAQADDAKKIEAKQAEQASGFDDAFADMMGMEKAVPLGGGFVPKSGLVVANIGKGGRIYYGRPGDIHASLSERYPHKDRGDWEQVGFAGPDGKFLTREQALEFAQKEGKVKTSDNMKGQLDAMDYRESAEPAKPVDDIERRETYGEPPDGNERRRYGLRFEGSEPLTEGRNDAEKHAIDKYGKENLYRVKVNDAEGKEVADAIIKEEGDTLIVPWLGKKGSASGEGKGKDLFGTREMTALGKQLAETYPDMNILKYQVGNDRNNAGAHRIVDLNKYRSRLAKKAEKQAQPADPNDNSTRAVVSRALGDRMQDLGAGVYRVTHGDRYLDVTTNGPDRAIINFDHIDPETAEGLTGTADPANLGLSKGTKAIFSDMKAIVEGLRKAGKIIEYDATPVVGAGNRLSRSSLYERLLTKAGYERVQKESFSKSAIWKPKETPVEPKMTKEELFKVKMLDWRDLKSGEWEEISRHTHLDDAKQAAGKDGATGQVDSGRTAGDADKSVLPYGLAVPEFVAYRKKSATQPKETPKTPEEIRDEIYKREVDEMMKRHEKVEKELYQKYQDISKSAKNYGEQADAHMRYIEAKRANEFEKAELYQKFKDGKSAEKEQPAEPVQSDKMSESPAPENQLGQNDQAIGKKTKLDHILDRVDKDGEVTLTIKGEPLSRAEVQRVIETSKARGIDAAFDGNNFLFRKLGPEGTKARAKTKKERELFDKQTKKMNELAKPRNDAFKKTERREDLTIEEHGLLNDFATRNYVKEGDKYVYREPSGQNDQADFGKPLTPEEKNLGQARGGSPAGDELPRLEGGLKEFALANEAVDAERKSLGLPPLMASARKSFGEVWDRAMVVLGKDANASADLVNDLSKKMRNLSDEESALLLHRHIQFNNAYERTIRQASAAAAVAHKTKNYAEFDRIANRADEILNEIKRIGDITKKTGSEAGRTLAFRRQMAAEDYSLGRMMARMEIAKKAPLTPEERQKVQDQHDKIKRLEERLRDFEAKEAAEADVIDLQPAEQPGMFEKVKGWLGGIFKPKQGLGRKPTKAWEFADRMEREAAKELMQKFGPGKLFSGFDPTAIAPLAKYTAAKIIKSGLTFADFSKQIVARFGDAVKPHLDDIWKQAQSHADLGKMDKVDVQVEQKKTRSLYDEMIAAFQRKNQSLGRKGWEGIKETNNIMRLIQTSMDLSGIGRQGGPLALINPTKVPAAIKEMIQSIKSEHGYERNQMQIRNRKNARDYELGELEFTDHNADPTRQEESIAGRFTGKIPGVAASARAFNGFLNRLRADAFDAMSATITSRGQERVTELRDIGNWINAITGRGRTGYRRIDDATAHLAQVFYSPRHAISRFQVLSGQPFWGAGTWKSKKLIAQQYAKYAIGMGAVYGLAKLVLGDEAEIEKDPRSSDLGKIKIGRTRIDPLAGLSQSAVVTSRLLTGESKSPQTGEVKDLRGKGHKFKDQTSLKVAGQFVRNKLTPLAGEVSDFIAPELTPPGEGKGPLTKMTGEQKGKLGWAIRQADKPLPLTFGDMYDAFKEHGYTRAAAISLLATLGWGSQVHDSEHKKK